MLYERARCSTCGTFPDEWVTALDDPSGEPYVIPPPYEADTVECRGCAERERFEKAVFPKYDQRPPGVFVVLQRANASDYMESMKTGPSKLDLELAED